MYGFKGRKSERQNRNWISLEYGCKAVAVCRGHAFDMFSTSFCCCLALPTFNDIQSKWQLFRHILNLRISPNIKRPLNFMRYSTMRKIVRRHRWDSRICQNHFGFYFCIYVTWWFSITLHCVKSKPFMDYLVAFTQRLYSILIAI